MTRAKTKRIRYEPGHVGTEPSKRPVSLRRVILVAGILMVAGGIIALSVTVPDKTAVPVVATPGFGQAIPSLANNSGILNPRDYQYDPVTDRYWDPRPGHVHWHAGLPTANAGTTTTLGPATIANGSFSGTPNIVNPAPWQYDPATNKHWHAEGNHWDNGPPPANAGTGTPAFGPTTLTQSSATPNIVNPAPWQYDPATNKHWVADHGHWHNGPAPDNR